MRTYSVSATIVLMANPKGFIRALMGLFLLAALLAVSLTPMLMSAQAAPHLAVAPGDVVISQFRTRGPSPISAGALDEFIELYNRTTASVDISGWKINESNNTGVVSPTPVAAIPLTPATIIQSGQYYLIANNTSPGGYSGAVPADLTYTLGIPDDGGIALIEADGITISDQVGMSTGSAYREPSNPPPPPILPPLIGNTDQSYQRLPGGTQGGCTDANINSSDFTLITPSVPHDLASTPGTCLVAPAPTFTSAPVLTPTITHTPTSAFFNPPVIINEIGWSGTPTESSTAQWIELYNPQASDLNLNGWILAGQYGSPNIILTGVIPHNGYYLLVHGTSTQATSAPTAPPPSTPEACIVFNPTDVKYDQIFTGSLSTYGQTLFLRDPSNFVVDTANFYGSRWPAGSFTNHASMERRGVVPDTPDAWITYSDTVGTVRDCGEQPVFGTPKRQNWAFGKVLTPTPSPEPTKRPTHVPPTPFAHVVINEFLPRPGFDWNNDGQINVYDEFIEIENLGPINVNLSGWKLDNVAGGSHFYSLPAKTLKSGERALYYGSVSHIPLLDSGGTVRLINNRGIVVDARGYGIATVPDVSHCRIPDGDGYWRDSCFPTPNTENALTGTEPALPPAAANKPPACLLPDTVPDPFREAVCNAYGGNILNGDLWDELAGQKIFPVPDKYNKSQTTIQ